MKYSVYIRLVLLVAIAVLVAFFFFLSYEGEEAGENTLSENSEEASAVEREPGFEDTEELSEAKEHKVSAGKGDDGEDEHFLTAAWTQNILEAGIGWMVGKQEENGHFKYEYYPLTDTYSAEDHVTRQMGALYVLGEILKRDIDKVFVLKEPVEKAIAYARENTVEGYFNGHDFLCVMHIGDRCTLGGTSLALVGVLDLVEVHPERAGEYAELIKGYKNFILAMKKQDSGFMENYYLSSTQTETESSFSNGEAFLALVRYYLYKPDDDVKEVLEDSFTYFNRIYRGEWDANFYLWGMATLKDIYGLWPREEYVDFVKEYTDHRISVYRNLRGINKNVCAYIEGVASAYSVLERSGTEEEKKEYIEEINFWLLRNSAFQVGKEGEVITLVGGREVGQKSLNTQEARGGFLTGFNAGEAAQRIDFTQHCLSAYLQKIVDIDSSSPQ